MCVDSLCCVESPRPADEIGAQQREVPLAGGRMTPGVVRVGETVRRPLGAHSAFVHDLLRLLERRAVHTAPRLIGIDEQGRETLSFREGWAPPNLEWRRWSNRQVVAAARIVRGLHDATAGSALAKTAEVVCHGDLSPCNFVFVGGEPRLVIDFDRAHPDSRKSDLAYMAWMWLIGEEDENYSAPFAARLRQLTLLLDSYGLDDRRNFAAAIEAEQQQTLAMHQATGNSAAEWVQSEIRFIHEHASDIDCAAHP
jgi:aminoglycoside phosphotransferase (APT) family kinase protein